MLIKRTEVSQKPDIQILPAKTNTARPPSEQLYNKSGIDSIKQIYAKKLIIHQYNNKHKN